MADVALAWLIAQTGITSVLAGGRTAAQVYQNAKAQEVKLPPDVLKALTDATDEVKLFLGDDADPWAWGRIN